MCYLIVEIKTDENNQYDLMCASQYYSRSFVAWHIEKHFDNWGDVINFVTDVQNRVESENKEYSEENEN
jgi:hypothetical protein